MVSIFLYVIIDILNCIKKIFFSLFYNILLMFLRSKWTSKKKGSWMVSEISALV